MRPLIYTVVYGSDLYFECFQQLLTSIVKYANYDGELAVISDRNEQDLRHYIPGHLQDRFICIHRSNLNLISRYLVDEAYFRQHVPVLCLDNDIIVDSDISDLLHQIADAQPRICVTTELQLWGHLFKGRICDIVDQRRIGNWFGLELLRSDPDCSQELLPLTAVRLSPGRLSLTS
jgi:hypothetical protein